jgi:MFS family permease
LNQLRALEQSPWGCVVSGLVTVLCIILFIRRETRIAQPILDLRFFRDWDFALVTAAHALLNLAGFSIMLLVPFYLDRLGGLSVPAGGLALASSPAGVMLAGPVAGWLARTVSPRRLALIGETAMAVAQISIGMADAPANVPVLVASMFLQGVGLGLFQVACFDISTATIPRADRGVAGSLVMMTRTVGVVTAATVLMLIFQSVRSTSVQLGVPDQAAFLAGFHAAFQFAAALPVLVVLAGLWRGWGSARQ